MSPSKAFRLSLAKVADALFDLAVTVTTVEQSKIAIADVQESLGDDGLIVLLDGQQGLRGAMVLDVQLLSALIEVQTMGKVRSGEAPARPVTRTDAAIAAPLVNALLEGYVAEMRAAEQTQEPAAFRFGDRMEDTRSLVLALAMPTYDLYRISVDIADGAKAGLLSILLPTQPKLDQTSGKKAHNPNRLRLEESAKNAPVVLDAVIANVTLPLNEIWKLEPGALLPVDRDSIDKGRLLGAKGHVVANVKLGQLNGWRAVRLVSEDGLSNAPSPKPAPEAQTARRPEKPSAPPQVMKTVRDDGAAAARPGAAEINPDQRIEDDTFLKPADTAIGPDDRPSEPAQDTKGLPAPV